MHERIGRKITCLSWILAIGVVFIHTFNLEVYGIWESAQGFEGSLWHIETYLNTIFNRVCVPFFFFISGYLFYRNYDWNKVWTKYRSRVVSLLLPYILWCTLYFIAYYIITHVPILKTYMNMEPVSMTFSYYLSCLWNSTYTVLWFVKYLILTVIPAPLFFLFFSKKVTKAGKGLSYIISFLIIGYAVLHKVDIPNVYFLVGGWISIHLSDFMEKEDQRKTIAGILILVVCLVCVFAASNILWVFGMIFAMWFAMDVFPYHKPTRNLPGGQTFFLYCAHSLLLEGLEKVWVLVAGRTPVAAAIDYFCMPFVVIAIVISISTFLNRYCSPAYSILVGGRK